MADEQAKGVQDVEPEEIEREIERTRDDLAATIDAIADRVSPKRVASRGVASAKDTARNVVAAAQQRVARLRGGEEITHEGDQPRAVGTFQVRRRPPTAQVVAGAAAVGGLLLTALLRRRFRRSKHR